LIGGQGSLGRKLSGEELDQALEAFADYADVKSPFTLGRSRGVAQLAATAAATLGLPSDDVVLVRRAALVHDIGAIGVPAGILDKPGRLTEAERERVRTHPYLTARTFSKPQRWQRSGSSPRSTTSGWTDRATRRASRPTASR
ncbi:MAG: HD-GYP domain-containing protein, partial [Actinomycetota bacterium]